MDRAERIRRYGLWRTLWRRLMLLQRPVFGYQRLRCLVLPASASPIPAEPGFTVRQVGFDELRPLAASPGSWIPAKAFAAAERQRHLCVGVFDGNRLVSFSFNAAGRARFNDQFEFVVPDGWIYHYMAVTLPEWRGRGLHALQMPFLLERARSRRCKGIVTLVESINYASLRSFARMGFAEHRVFSFLGRRSRQRVISPGSSEGFGFV
jgi:GNAT superfamily N-acetyltransferase